MSCPTVTKSAAADAIRHIQATAEKTSGRKLRMLCTDNDREFTATEFTDYCTDDGITCHYSSPYSLQQNGVVERRNRPWWPWRGPCRSREACRPSTRGRQWS